jgi:hypothetical protein
MTKLLRLPYLMRGLDFFESLFVAFVLDLHPLFVEQFAGLRLRSVHFNLIK